MTNTVIGLVKIGFTEKQAKEILKLKYELENEHEWFITHFVIWEHIQRYGLENMREILHTAKKVVE